MQKQSTAYQQRAGECDLGYREHIPDPPSSRSSAARPAPVSQRLCKVDARRLHRHKESENDRRRDCERRREGEHRAIHVNRLISREIVCQQPFQSTDSAERTHRAQRRACKA